MNKNIYKYLSKKPTESFAMKFVLGVIVFGALIGGCSYVNDKFGLSDDNMMEEFLENQFKEETGIDFDFTPATSENDRY